MRKFICTVIALVCLLTPCVSAMSFVDVPQSEWYYEDVKGAVESGIINGKTTTEYKPNDNLTYAEAVKLAACMHQLHTIGKVTLANGSPVWYSTYVEYCKNNNILSGEYEYNYNAKATRAGYMTIFANALPNEAMKQINSVADNSIPDVPSSKSYAPFVYKLYRAGILQGVDEKHNCNPDSYIKRSEVAAIITRMMNEDKRVTFSIAEASDTKDNYVPKLEESKPTQKPNDSDFENTGGKPTSEEGRSGLVAGEIATNKEGLSTPRLDKNLGYSDNLAVLNGYVGNTYGSRRFFGDGISINDEEDGRCARIVQDGDRWGINVFQWRKSYDSDIGTNTELNMVMEAFYFICGDREVAYALWQWQDAMSINRTAWAEDFGFTVVKWDGNDEKVISMNNIEIEIDWEGLGQTFYFK